MRWNDGMQYADWAPRCSEIWFQFNTGFYQEDSGYDDNVILHFADFYWGEDESCNSEINDSDIKTEDMISFFAYK